jgi:hypothetical protein
MLTCDLHLSEGMSHLLGQPAPDHWRVFPLHEGSPPYCAVTCPTCHPTQAIHIARIEVHADDPDRLAFGLVDAFTRKVTTMAAKRTTCSITTVPELGPLTIKSDPTMKPGEMRMVQEILIDGLTPEQCRERWLENRSEQECGAAGAMYAMTPAQIETGKRYRRVTDMVSEILDRSVLRVKVQLSDAERKAREPRVLVDTEDE